MVKSDDRVVAAVELTAYGVKRMVIVARNAQELAEGHRILAGAAPAIHELDRCLSDRQHKVFR